ncbi:ABC transporter ATP-binding protein [Methanospirillum stamsii]|uniref:ABC transporter ATP-binding protein n=1 Tax=Methanospirillum stamsii TaxID=1277351 RepID=A0A2V2NGU0_9EURY|nr:ABC transporter ATP-binding protein [Methanospirillum stamsii]PWR74543.1 ABC transporter ATP-binding protein [Methanospirillum stamsii]
MQSVKKPESPFRRLLSFAGHRKWLITGAVLLTAIGTLLGFIPFLVIYLITVELLSPPIDGSYIWYLAIVVLLAAVGRVVFLFISTILSHMAAFDTLFGIKRTLIQKIGDLPLGYLNKRTSGSVTKIITEDVDRIELFIAHHLTDSVGGILLPVFAIGYMITIDWRIALVSLIPIPLALIAIKMAYRESENKSMKKYYDALDRMNGIIVEYIRGMPVVKVFNQTARSFHRLSDSVSTYRDFVIEWTKECAPSYSAFSVCVNLPLLFILPTCVWFFVNGSITIPEMLLFLILGTGYTSTMMKMAKFGGIWRQITEGISRIDALLTIPDLIAPAVTKTPRDYSISFKDVTFSYEKSPAIQNISFTAPEKTVTALVGPSGSGKSTIAQLIPRFWDASKGMISIGGVNVTDIEPEKLMDMVGFVFQDSFLFHESIEENIRMGKPEKPFDEVVAAAKAAQAHEFIMALPDGYNTIIGSEGTYLSGGEQQRIILARTIFKDAPIVILDEATAFADPENEYKIQQAIDSLLKHKTVIMIAHRLSTIAHADQIIVLSEGRIIENGKHQALIEQNGQYSRMWESHSAARSWRFNTGGVA